MRGTRWAPTGWNPRSMRTCWRRAGSSWWGDSGRPALRRTGHETDGFLGPAGLPCELGARSGLEGRAAMALVTELYSEQVKAWPREGRHILAQYDDETVVV